MKKMAKTSKKTSMNKKEKLFALINSSKDGQFIRVSDAKKALGLSGIQASKTLAHFSKQGWLERVLHGVYMPVAFDESNDGGQVLNDPWALVPEMFPSYYIGGLSAASYWGLTDQTFRSAFVFTTKATRKTTLSIQNYKFIVKTIKKEKMFGKDSVWRGGKKVFVSDIYKTLIDMLDDPLVGGGIHHVFECLNDFLTLKGHRLRRRYTKGMMNADLLNRRKGITTGNLLHYEDRKKDIEQLIKYSEKINNGAVFKRLGFFAEKIGNEELIHFCSKNLTKGYSKLDPSLKCEKNISRWRLKVPKNF